MNNKTNAEDKITLPKNVQREMMKFFLRTSIPTIAAEKEKNKDREHQQTSPNLDEAKGC